MDDAYALLAASLPLLRPESLDAVHPGGSGARRYGSDGTTVSLIEVGITRIRPSRWTPTYDGTDIVQGTPQR